MAQLQQSVESTLTCERCHRKKLVWDTTHDLHSVFDRANTIKSYRHRKISIDDIGSVLPSDRHRAKRIHRTT